MHTAQQAQTTGDTACKGPLEQLLDAGTHRRVDACALQRGLEHGDQQIVRQCVLQAAALRLREERHVELNKTVQTGVASAGQQSKINLPCKVTLVIGRAQCADDHDVVHAGRAALVSRRVAS